jgi:hypothetical protein
MTGAGDELESGEVGVEEVGGGEVEEGAEGAWGCLRRQ